MFTIQFEPFSKLNVSQMLREAKTGPVDRWSMPVKWAQTAPPCCETQRHVRLIWIKCWDIKLLYGKQCKRQKLHACTHVPPTHTRTHTQCMRHICYDMHVKVRTACRSAFSPFTVWVPRVHCSLSTSAVPHWVTSPSEHGDPLGVKLPRSSSVLYSFFSLAYSALVSADALAFFFVGLNLLCNASLTAIRIFLVFCKSTSLVPAAHEMFKVFLKSFFFSQCNFLVFNQLTRSWGEKGLLIFQESLRYKEEAWTAV